MAAKARDFRFLRFLPIVRLSRVSESVAAHDNLESDQWPNFKTALATDARLSADARKTSLKKDSAAAERLVPAITVLVAQTVGARQSKRSLALAVLNPKSAVFLISLS